MISPMTRNQKITVITLGVLLAIAVLVVTVLFATPKVIYTNGSFYKQDPRYSPSIPGKHGIITGCTALSPECGACPLVRGNVCYTAL